MASVDVRQVEAQTSEGKPYEVPYWEVRTGKDGPRVLVTAAMHGNEVQGSEVIRRCLPYLSRDLTCGSAVLVPLVNVMAIRNHQPHIDFELSRFSGGKAEDNLNCTWPGADDGNSAYRLTHALYHALVPESTHLVDLHCWNCFWAATALVPEGHGEAIRLANATALRFARQGAPQKKAADGPSTPCLLSAYFNNTGRTGICIEFAGQYGFWPAEVERGVRALRNCFRALGTLPGDLEARDEGPIWLHEADEIAVTAPRSGLFVRGDWQTSDRIEKGACLGHVLTDTDLVTVELHAPDSGYLYQYGYAHENTSEHSMMWLHPHVKEGEVVAKIIVPH